MSDDEPLAAVSPPGVGHPCVAFDLSQMGPEEREYVTGLRVILGGTFTEAFAGVMAIHHMVELGVELPYEGWFQGIEGEQREALLVHVRKGFETGYLKDPFSAEERARVKSLQAKLGLPHVEQAFTLEGALSYRLSQEEDPNFAGMYRDVTHGGDLSLSQRLVLEAHTSEGLAAGVYKKANKGEEAK